MKYSWILVLLNGGQVNGAAELEAIASVAQLFNHNVRCWLSLKFTTLLVPRFDVLPA